MHSSAAGTHAGPVAERDDGPAELLRRVLLGTITALIVARPLVLGEDPGLLLRQFQVGDQVMVADTSGLVLTLLWFVTAVGWAIWRLWTRNGRWGVGAVEGGLLVVVTLMFLSAIKVAAYKNPAFLVAWEWLALWIAFCLVRQLVRTPGENQRLLAAVVASGISLAVYALYQYSDELPRNRRFFEEMLEASQGAEGAAKSAQQYRDRLDLGVFATFAHPNSYSGYLALLLPAGVGWGWVSWRRRGGDWRTYALLGCALMMATALVLTRSKGAVLGTVLVAGAAVLILARRRLAAYRGWVVAGLIVLAGIAYLGAVQGSAGAGVDKTASALGKRLDYWKATGKMLTDPAHPAFFWLGVGPDNFSRYYPRFMAPAAHDEIVRDPHNFALDVWTSCGVFGLAALLVALFAFFRRVAPAVLSASTADPGRGGDEPQRTHWEFYLGGMVGLTLGFVLWALGHVELKPDELVYGGFIACVRSVIWFAAFALLESVLWPGSTRVLALAAGVAALLLNLTVSGGISFPSVALPLWVLVALALNALPRPEASRPPNFYAALAPLPLTAVLAFVYVLLAFAPVTSCHRLVQKTLPYFAPYEAALVKAKEGQAVQEQNILNGAQRYLRERILKPLTEAAREDRSDTHPPLLLAEWYGKQWKLKYEIEGRSDENVRKAALSQAQIVTQLDPEGLEGYMSLYRLNLLFATRADPETKKKLYDYAARALRKAVDRAPAWAYLRYQLAETLFLADKKDEARQQAEKALELDRLAPTPQRKLLDSQRRQARTWLGLSEGE